MTASGRNQTHFFNFSAVNSSPHPPFKTSPPAKPSPAPSSRALGRPAKSRAALRPNPARSAAYLMASEFTSIHALSSFSSKGCGETKGSGFGAYTCSTRIALTGSGSSLNDRHRTSESGGNGVRKPLNASVHPVTFDDSLACAVQVVSLHDSSIIAICVHKTSIPRRNFG